MLQPFVSAYLKLSKLLPMNNNTQTPDAENDDVAILAANKLGIKNGPPLAYFIDGWKAYESANEPKETGTIKELAEEVFDKWKLDYDGHVYLTRDLFTLAIQDSRVQRFFGSYSQNRIEPKEVKNAEETILSKLIESLERLENGYSFQAAAVGGATEWQRSIKVEHTAKAEAYGFILRKIKRLQNKMVKTSSPAPAEPLYKFTKGKPPQKYEKEGTLLSGRYDGRPFHIAYYHNTWMFNGEKFGHSIRKDQWERVEWLEQLPASPVRDVSGKDMTKETNE